MVNVSKTFPIQTAPRLGAAMLTVHPLYAATADAEIAREINWLIVVG